MCNILRPKNHVFTMIIVEYDTLCYQQFSLFFYIISLMVQKKSLLYLPGFGLADWFWILHFQSNVIFLFCCPNLWVERDGGLKSKAYKNNIYYRNCFDHVIFSKYLFISVISKNQYVIKFQIHVIFFVLKQHLGFILIIL